MKSYQIIKRTLDFLVSLTGLILLLPVFAVLSLLVVLDSRGGVFFRGERVGLHGRSFKIFKFRSMIPDCEGKGKWNVGDNDDRITRVGHFVRKSKLDELPQLINVVKGDMSLVGPRPELRCYVDMYTEREMPILDNRPGITDWASITNFEQFKGFTAAADPDEYYLNVLRPLKLTLQLYYREHMSLKNDFRCLFWTAYKVITHSSRLPADVQSIVDGYTSSRETEKHSSSEQP